MRNLVIFIFLLILLTSLSACGSYVKPAFKLDPYVYYRNDLCVSLRGGPEACGVATFPNRSIYEIQVHVSTDTVLLSLRSCHEETTYVPKRRTTTFYRHRPLDPIIACPIFITAYDKFNNHKTAFITFENFKYKLKATWKCNGEVKDVKGVSVCQAREGLLQRVYFNEQVEIGEPVNGPATRLQETEPCEEITTTWDKKSTKLFTMSPRECIYPVIGIKSGEMHQLYTVGYEAFIVRK